MKAENQKRIIISGGGTGGHIFPAIAIANAIVRLEPSADILFVGALGRMEMEKVPAAGYRIIGLNIQGFQRRSIIKNLLLPFKILKSILKAKAILRNFRPHVAIGVGGYASGPLLIAARQEQIPYLVQEQNSYAGRTNKYLGERAEKVCVAFDDMDLFFPSEKILFTGNPIRKEVVEIAGKKEAGLAYHGLSVNKKTLLITGGSLGAQTLNESVMMALDKIMEAEVQVIWQCGSYYFEAYNRQLNDEYRKYIILTPFLQKMDMAYAAADIIISRAGAGTIAELCAVAKPMILVPSPNVAEDHQTRNAEALVNKNAALLVKDHEAKERLIEQAIVLLENSIQCDELSRNSKKLAILNADELIAHEVLAIAETHRVN